MRVVYGQEGNRFMLRDRLIWLIGIWTLHWGWLSGQDTTWLNQDLAGYWTFDEYLAGGIIQDLSGYESDGKASGTILAPGVKGHALRFDGLDDVVTITEDGSSVPGHMLTLGEGSISVWFRLNGLPEGEGIQPIFYFGALEPCSNRADAANQGIIIEVGHHPVHLYSDRIYFTIFGNGCREPSFCFDSGEDLEAGRWYHFVTVVGEQYNNGYLDGEPMLSIQYNFGNSFDSQFFEDVRQKDVIWLGKGYWNAKACHLDGWIDELRIYRRPLTEKEVRQLYRWTTGSTGDQAGISGADIRVFPNPVSRLLHVCGLDMQPEKPIRFLITDAAGHLMMMEEPVRVIDLAGIPAGSFHLVIENDRGSRVYPFIKME